ncbi:MAG: hypothetical protein U0Q18_28305 [Bryobacteraceae bacterium]
MPDELRPDDIPNLWREEPREPVSVPLDAVRRRAGQFEAQTRRGFRTAGLMMVCSCACYALFLYVFPGVLQRLGCSLTLAAYLYCAYQFRRKGGVKQVLAEAPAATCAAYRAELQRLHDFSFISNLMVPFIPGPAMFVLGFLVPEIGASRAVGLTAALIASPFVLALPLVRRKRQLLEGEIRSLDTLMK